MPKPVLLGLKPSGNTIPILALIAESGCECDFEALDLSKGAHMQPEFLAINPMHCSPTLKEGDWAIWECRAIMRYLCNKYKLEAFYPSDPQTRAVIDCALDWNLHSLNPVLGNKMTYPYFGFSGPIEDTEFAAAEVKWNKDLLPAFERLLTLSGGPLIGGARPSIADFAIVGYLEPCTLVFPEGPVATAPAVVKYLAEMKKACPKHDEWFADAKELCAMGAAKVRAAGK